MAELAGPRRWLIHVSDSDRTLLPSQLTVPKRSPKSIRARMSCDDGTDWTLTAETSSILRGVKGVRVQRNPPGVFAARTKQSRT